MNTKSCAPILVLVMALISTVCTAGIVQDERISSARTQADVFLETLREGDWDKAADCVLMNDAAWSRFGLREDADTSELAEHIQELLKSLYQDLAPGPIVAVRLDHFGTGDRELVIVEYRHGDLDGFFMRLVDDRWLYSFE
jgi:hypothetical protein